jgi:glycosyltransferase involved in cell wall biosynthesis
MKCLLVHNLYQQPGGEDHVLDAEKAILTRAGHQVIEYIRDNAEILEYGLRSKATLWLRTVWAWDSCRDLQDVLGREKPDLVHFHNTFPLISPAAYYACQEARVPVVQTLHNYRLLCPSATLFRDNKVCEDCVEHGLLRSIGHGCYRGSRPATAVVALMLAAHRLGRTWNRMVDCYIALTEFARQEFIAAGLPPERIVVKPNFVDPDPSAASGIGGYVLFVGRLSPEKGLRTLLAAWKRLRIEIPLQIVGDGPDREELEAHAAQLGLNCISFLGRKDRGCTMAAIQGARFLVFPSKCYEGFPVTIAEAFASGRTVICSRLGAMQEVVTDGCTGLHFNPDDAEDLAQKVKWAWTHPEPLAEMEKAARAEYEAKYTAERNYSLLMEIYERARAEALIGHRTR